MNDAAPTHILGVDPGISGALALYAISDRHVEVFDMPVTDGRVDPAKLAGIVEMCKLRGSIVAAVELTSSMPRQKGSYNFGLSNGIVHGVLGAMGVPFYLIQPAQWKGAMGLRKIVGESQAENKTRSRELATKLWPEVPGEFTRKKDDGRAEAALISRFFANKMGY